MADAIKTRDPSKLKDDDYYNFLLGLPLFEADHFADPDFYPIHRY